MPNETRGAEDPPGTRDPHTSKSLRKHLAATRRAGRAVVVTTAAALVLATALAACASSNKVGPAAAGGTLIGSASASAVPPITLSPPASGGSTAGSGTTGPGSRQPVPPSMNPGGPNQGGQLGSPVAQAPAPPAGAKYVPIEQIGRSADGRTLYLEIMAQAGACGRYVVVVQESSSQVAVGLAHLPVKVGVMCPMLVRIAQFPAQLAAPLGSRTVIDLATGKVAGTVGVIPLPLPEGGNPAGY